MANTLINQYKNLRVDKENLMLTHSIPQASLNFRYIVWYIYWQNSTPRFVLLPEQEIKLFSEDVELKTGLMA